MNRIIIRTLGGKNIGYGHYFRCLSLAKAIKSIDEKMEIVFLINEELNSLIQTAGFKFIIESDLNKDIDIVKNLEIDLFILDSYLGNDEYLESIKEKTKLMIIDDNNDIYDSSIPDIIYNGNIHAESLDYKIVEGQMRLLGQKYLIMKEEYWSEDTPLLPKDGVLVTTGGTDEYGITLNIIDVIKELDISIKVIIGPGYKDDYIKKIERMKIKNIDLIYKPSSIKEYINSSKIVITAGGSTIYEILSQKSIPIVFSIADNQDLLCKTLKELRVPYLGKYPNIDYSRLRELIEKLQDKGNIEEEKTFNLIDGKGAVTTAKILVSQINRRIKNGKQKTRNNYITR